MHWSYMLPPLIINNLALLMRHRVLRRRHGNIPVRIRRAGKTKWSRGHALWVHDVFAFRASPAAWYESLDRVAAVEQREPRSEERRKLRHRLGDDMAVGTLRLHDGGSLAVATRRRYGPALFGNLGQSHDVAISPDAVEAT